MRAMHMHSAMLSCMQPLVVDAHAPVLLLCRRGMLQQICAGQTPCPVCMPDAEPPCRRCAACPTSLGGVPRPYRTRGRDGATRARAHARPHGKRTHRRHSLMVTSPSGLCSILSIPLGPRDDRSVLATDFAAMMDALTASMPFTRDLRSCSCRGGHTAVRWRRDRIIQDEAIAATLGRPLAPDFRCVICHRACHTGPPSLSSIAYCFLHPSSISSSGTAPTRIIMKGLPNSSKASDIVLGLSRYKGGLPGAESFAPPKRYNK